MSDGQRCTRPGQARQVMDDIEATIEAEAAGEHHGGLRGDVHGDLHGDLHGDWAPAVPGSGEPPD